VPAALFAVLSSGNGAFWAAVFAGGTLLGGLLSWVLGRWFTPARTSLTFHAGLGAVLGLCIALAFCAPDNSLGLLVIFAVTMVPAGIVCAVVSTAAAMRLPQRVLAPLAVLALVSGAAALPWGVWHSQQPPAAYDYLAVDATPEVEMLYGGTQGLAEAVAQRFELVPGDRTANQVWEGVIDDLGSSVGDARLHAALFPEEGKPVLNGEPARLVEVEVREDGKACVFVTQSEVRVSPGECPRVEELD
jgi:hypothetical protein